MLTATLPLPSCVVCCGAQFAGAMARVARSPWFKTFRPADAARYLQNAVKAWDFLATKAPFGALCYHFYGCIGGMEPASASPPPWHNTYNCYDPQNDQSHDERLWAAVELYAATGESKYHDFFLQRHCPRYRRWGWQMLPFSYGLATVSYAQLAVQANASSSTNATLQVHLTPTGPPPSLGNLPAACALPAGERRQCFHKAGKGPCGLF